MAKITAVSPLAPKSYPELPEIEGVRFSTAEAGIRYKGRTDVTLALFDKGTQVAGVFTKKPLDQEQLDALEEMLIEADLGPHSAARITRAFSDAKFGKSVDEQEIKEAPSSMGA
jgi:signal recognition particle GTPase